MRNSEATQTITSSKETWFAAFINPVFCLNKKKAFGLINHAKKGFGNTRVETSGIALVQKDNC